MIAGIEPGKSPAQRLHEEIAPAEILVVDTGDLELAPRGRLHVSRDLHDVVVVEIKPRHRVVGLRALRLLLDGDRPPVLVEFNDAVLSRIFHVIAEDRRALLPLRRRPKHPGEALAVEDIVAQHQRDPVVSDEIGAENEGFRQSVGLRLDLVCEMHAELASISEEFLEGRKIPRRRDDQNIPDPRQHQRGQRIIDHRLVIDRHQLLADRFCQRVKTRTASSRQNDSLHRAHLCPYML